MLSEGNTNIGNNALTRQYIPQRQTPHGQYGYGTLDGSDTISSGYPGGGFGNGDAREEDQSEGLNPTGPEIADEVLSTTPMTISGSPGSPISGIDHDEHGEVAPVVPETSARRRDRVGEYEEYCRRSPLTLGKGKGKGTGGGTGLGMGRDAGVVEFRVKKEAWVGGVASPIARFPNEVLTHTFSFLDPATLSALSLVSKRFHALISSPHAWRSAFARYFAAQEHLPTKQQQRSISSAAGSTVHRSHDEETRASYSSERRYFTRLSSEPSWRKEYLLRTALLRSLARGKAHVPQYTPPKYPNRRNTANIGSIITYQGRTGGHSVTHISATFPSIDRSPKKEGNGDGQGRGRGQGTAALRPHLTYGSCENGMVGCSDPTTGRIETPTINTPLQRLGINWAEHGLAAHRPGIELGSSIMELSDEMGWCMGETVPGGRVYVEPTFLVHSMNRGYFLHMGDDYPEEGDAYISSLWIAKKKKGVFETSGGSCGLFVGESSGRATMYRLPNNSKETGNHVSWVAPVKTWFVSPGVPIVGIKVDEDYSVRRERRYKRRKEGMVVVVVNALGEVWYLRDFEGPWRIIEQTRRRVAFMDEDDVKEIGTVKGCLGLEWERVRRLWKGWGMDYFLEVDFAGGNVILGTRGTKYVNLATGEVEKCIDGLEEQKGGWVRCFRFIAKTKVDAERFSEGVVVDMVIPPKARRAWPLIFGGGESPILVSEDSTPLSDDIGEDPFDNATTNLPDEDIWSVKDLRFSNDQTSHKTIEITAFAIDKSILALLSPDEDTHADGKTHDPPGLNARLFAAGTSTGSIYVWNVRSPTHTGPIDNPLRVIHTDSPTITTLGLTSLYLIHGGNDGLVQCWDPLASTLDPIRTIHSRFSSRARRRMVQAEQNIENLTSDNQYAARAVQLDPDPAALRGVIALGTHIRYWSFAGDFSSAINGKRKKAVRRAGVGGGGTGTVGRRGVVENLKGEIVGELGELSREKERKEKEKKRLRDKFGLEAGLTEEEMLVYARMLSEEVFEKERDKQMDIGGVADRGSPSKIGEFAGEPVARTDEDEEAALVAALAASLSEAEYHGRDYHHVDHTPVSSSLTSPSPSWASIYETDSMYDYKHGFGEGAPGEKLDAELAEAIRLSFLDANPEEGVSFRYTYGDGSTPGGSGTSTTIASLAPNAVSGRAFAKPVTPAEESGGCSVLPASSSRGWGVNAREKKEKGGKKKWVGVDEWPSPRHAAMMVDGGGLSPGVGGGLSVGSVNGDGRGMDEDLEFALRLSLAEEESRRAVSVGGNEKFGVSSVGNSAGGTVSANAWTVPARGGIWGSKGKGRGI